MSAGLHISISAETIGHVAGIPISNSILTSLIVSGLLISFAVAVRLNLKTTGRPSGIQNVAEWMLEGLHSLVHGVTGSEKKTRHFFPLVSTFFLVILLNNWLGLLPGVGTIGFRETAEATEHARLAPSQVKLETAKVQASEVVTPEAAPAESHQTETTTEEHASETESHTEEAGAHQTEGKFVPYFRAGTADLNTTLSLAIISVLMTQVFGVMYLKIGYFSKFINFSSPITLFVGLLELVLEFAKVISFAFRLFGNVFAGEVLLAVITFLVPVVVPMPFYGLEIVVGGIQALVFAMLSTVFFTMATSGHEDH